MIGVQGQFLLSFKLDDRDVVERPQDLTRFYVKEEAGNVLPTFLFEGYISAYIVTRLNENGILEVSMGKDADTLITCNLYPIIVSANRADDGRFWAKVEGFMAKPHYFNNFHTRASALLSGVEVIRQVTTPFFRWDSNVETSEDRQHWIQPNTSDMSFVSHIWLRSYIANSWLACGISIIDETFILRDMKRLIGTEPRWNFTTRPTRPTDIMVMSALPQSTQGFQNSYHGYDQPPSALNLETGELETATNEITPLLASRGEVPRAPQIDTGRRAMPITRTANMHDNYHRALTSNQANIQAFSSFGVTLDLGDAFERIRVLDLATFADGSRGEPGAEFVAGNYIVASVARHFTGYTQSTQVKLTRESAGGF